MKKGLVLLMLTFTVFLLVSCVEKSVWAQVEKEVQIVFQENDSLDHVTVVDVWGTLKSVSFFFFSCFLWIKKGYRV